MEKLDVSITMDRLPPNYTCDGEDISPEIEVGGVGPNVLSMALVMQDSDSPDGGTFVHWIMWNIEPARMIPENIAKDPEITFPFEAVQGKNDFRRVGYSGPCPPAGNSHRYKIRIYGLDGRIDCLPGSDHGSLLNAMEGRIVAFGECEVVYAR